MLNVTTAARRFLAEKLEEVRTSEGEVMRVVADGASLSLKLGPIQADDRTIAHDGIPVLAIAPSVSEAADHRTLDVVMTVKGRRLRVTERTIGELNIRNPDAT